MSNKVSPEFREERLREIELMLGRDITYRLNQAESNGIREGASVVGTMCAVGGATLFMGASGGNFGIKEGVFYGMAITLGVLFGAGRGRYLNILNEVNSLIREFPDEKEIFHKWFYYKITS